MKPEADEEDKVKFLQEAAIMAQFKHPNVINLYGVVSTGGLVRCVYHNIIIVRCQKRLMYYINFEQVMIVVELLPKGDLKQYLESMKPE